MTYLDKARQLRPDLTEEEIKLKYCPEYLIYGTPPFAIRCDVNCEQHWNCEYKEEVGG